MSKLRTAVLEAQVEELKAKNKLLEQDFKKVIGHLHSARNSRKPPKIPTVKPARRGRRDIVRVIIPDSHGSAIHKPSAAAFLADLKTLDPDQIIMLGDHVDCGGFLAQHHTLGYVAQTLYSYEEDILHANGFLNEIQARAPKAKIEYLEGNHERRVETWCVTETLRHPRDAEMLRQALAPEFVLGLKRRGIRYFRQSECYDDLHVQGTIKRGKIFFWHGTSCARDAASVNLAQIGGNIVFGHTHRGTGLPTRDVANGVYGAWNPGCLCELQPMWKHTSPTTWTHGYALQLIAPSGNFLHINIGIVDGASLMGPLMRS